MSPPHSPPPPLSASASAAATSSARGAAPRRCSCRSLATPRTRCLFATGGGGVDFSSRLCCHRTFLTPPLLQKVRCGGGDLADAAGVCDQPAPLRAVNGRRAAKGDVARLFVSSPRPFVVPRRQRRRVLVPQLPQALLPLRPQGTSDSHPHEIDPPPPPAPLPRMRPRVLWRLHVLSRPPPRARPHHRRPPLPPLFRLAQRHPPPPLFISAHALWRHPPPHPPISPPASNACHPSIHPPPLPSV